MDTPATGGDAHLRQAGARDPRLPQPGIGFKDITPLLADPRALCKRRWSGLAEYARPLSVDCVVAAEARGFLLGPALALELGAGFVLARKPGKLPYETVSAEYLLEYGAGRARAAHRRAGRGQRVLVHDDLLATGGTAQARCASWSSGSGGEVVGCGFLIELAFLGGRARLAPARGARAALLRVLIGSGRWEQSCRPRAAPARSPPRREELWEMIRDPHHLPRWWPRVSRVEDVDGERVHRGDETAKGKFVRADFELVEVDERTRTHRAGSSG